MFQWGKNEFSIILQLKQNNFIVLFHAANAADAKLEELGVFSYYTYECRRIPCGEPDAECIQVIKP